MSRQGNNSKQRTPRSRSWPTRCWRRLLVRVGSDEDRENVSSGKTLGKASLTEMETDLVAVDGLKFSVLLKLQELSLSVEPKPVKRLKIG